MQLRCVVRPTQSRTRPGQGFSVAVGELEPFALHAHLLLPGALSRLLRLGILVAVARGRDDTLSQEELELVKERRVLEHTDRLGTAYKHT